MPTKIYGYLSKKTTAGPVLEIPFLIRDSIKNFGYASVYAGRVPNLILDYYLKNPLIGPLGKVIDDSVIDKKSLVEKIDRQSFVNGLDFYQIEYVVSKDDESYSSPLASLLEEISFKKIMIDGAHSFWYRIPKTIIISETNFDSSLNKFILADGWGDQEQADKSRWAMSHISQLFLSLKDNKNKNLVVDAEAIVKPQIASIYINDRYVGKMTFKTGGYSKQSLIIKNILKSGTNKITFNFKNIHDLSKIIPGSQDKRPLALHIKYIGLK